MMEARKRWKHFKYVVVGCIAILSCASCIETQPLLQGRRDGSASVVTNTVYHGCGYKDDFWMRHWNAGGDHRHHLLSVRSKYNYWYALAAVLSFGIYMPVDLEWRYDLGGECDCKSKEETRK